MIRILWQELTFGLRDLDQLAHVIIRLAAATLLGGLVGIQRESTRKPAGLRTHVLVSLATTAFVITCANTGMSLDGISRVIQGIVTGIGFIGAGTILKRPDANEIKGLTTAAGVWLTAAVGAAVGAGQLWLPLVAVVAAWVILALMRRFES